MIEWVLFANWVENGRWKGDVLLVIYTQFCMKWARLFTMDVANDGHVAKNTYKIRC